MNHKCDINNNNLSQEKWPRFATIDIRRSVSNLLVFTLWRLSNFQQNQNKGKSQEWLKGSHLCYLSVNCIDEDDSDRCYIVVNS